MKAHVFTFCFFGPDDRRTTQLAAIVVQGRMGQAGAIPTTYERAQSVAANPYCLDIQTARSRLLSKRSPRLDRICAEHTGFGCFLYLLIAVGGYRPTIRLDVMGQDGAVLARAYDRAQERRGDGRRASLLAGSGAGAGAPEEKRD